MALKLRQSSASRVRLLSTFIAVFALVLQPMYGFVAEQVANAAGASPTGVTRYVKGGGNSDATNNCLAPSNPCTLPYAINRADIGDTVLVDGMTYSGQVVIDKELHLVGVNNAKLINAVDLDTVVISKGASNTSIKGFNIENRNSNGKSALKITTGNKVSDPANDTTGLEVSGNTFSHTGTSTKLSHLIYGGNITDSKFTGNTFNISSNVKAMISDYRSNGIEVTGNIFVGTTDTTVLALNPSVDSKFSNNNLTGVTTTSDKIIEFKGASNVASGNIYGNNMVTIAKVDGSDFKGVYRTLNGALGIATAGDRLTASAGTYEESLNITKAVSLFGAGQGQTIIKSPSGNTHNYVIQILNVADNFSGDAISSLTVDGNNAPVHGINVFGSSSQMTIWGTTVKNNGKSGLNVNDSWVQGVNLATENNGWHGVNVDKGSAFFRSAGINHHNETQIHDGKPVPALYVDDATGTVNDTNSQYVSVDNYTKPGDRAYFLASEQPEAPTNLHRQDVAGKVYPCDVTTPAQAFSPYWTKSTSSNVTHYEYSSFNKSGVPGLVEKNLGNVDHMTNTTWIAADGTGYKFAVRAVNDLGLKSAWAECGISYDSEAPKLIGVMFNDMRHTADGVNYTSAKLNGGTLDVTFTTNEPLNINKSKLMLAVPGYGVPSTGYTPVSTVEGEVNTYVAHLDLLDGKSNGQTDFFKNKTFNDIRLRFMLEDEHKNSETTYYARNSDNTVVQSDVDGSADLPAGAKFYTFTIDNTSPLILSSTLDRAINPTKVTIKVTDDASGIDYVKYSIGTYDGGVYKEVVGYTEATDVDGDMYSGQLKLGLAKAPKSRLQIDKFFNDDFSLKDGEYLVRVHAYDKAGNKRNNVSVDQVFTIDRTAPDIVSSAYDPVAKQLTVVTNDDAQSVALRVGAVDLMPKSQLGNVWTFDVAAFNTPGKTYEYTATAADVAGNTTTTDTTDEVTSVVTKRSFTIPDPFVDGTPLPPVDGTLGFERVANTAARSFFGAPTFTSPIITGTADEDILGARDTKTASPEKTVAVIEPSTQGWKLFGIAWFWWVLMGALIAMIWWWIVAARRRSQEA